MTSLVEPVAIIGFAGKFPGAGDCAALWRLLSEGREGLRTLTDEQLLAAGVSPETLAAPNYVRVNGDIDGLELFDAPFFRMTPREATICDPQLRIFLETAHAAVENAGHDPTRLSDVGVFAATGHSLYMDHQLQGTALAAGQRDLLAGVFNYPDYVATLTSYKLDFTGPSLTVLTACSSSLLTLHLAIQALNNGECGMTLIGGTEVETWGQGYFWNSGGPLSQDGHCRPFDAHASGTVFSTGVGVVVLKRLPDAIRDGDTVHAVVRATAVNNDGADKVGFSAPSLSGQTAVVAEALGVADVEPESIGYVEAHGTGTALGDPIEFAALTEAFRRAAGGRELPNGYCGLGSVKSNIGHLGHAAGVVSLIKVAQCFGNDLLPATVNLKEPNPALALDGSPFYLLTEPRPWPRIPGRPRRAAINSLGFGGTNVHAVLEEPPLPAATPVAQRPRLVVWSARTDAAERDYRAALADHLRESGDGQFPATVSTLQEGRTRHPVRGFAVAASRPEAVDAVAREPFAARTVRSAGPRPVAFLFPGQGSQHVAMAAGLYRTEPTFTAELDAALDALAAAGADVRQLWSDGTEDDLLDTAVAQPLLFAVEYALAKMVLHWGVTPSAMLGHSIGELVAAAVAGMLPLSSVAAMVAARGRAMAAAPPGAMAAVRARAAELGELPAGVTVAAENGPHQTVVAGAEEDLSGFLSALAARGVAAARLRTAHAFHSPSMSASARAFAAEVPHLTASPATVPVISAATARPLTVEEAGTAGFWVAQICAPVRFGAALDELLGDGDWLLVEVGPGRALTSVLRGHPGVTEGRHQVLPTLPRRRGQVDDLRCVLEAAGALWAEGHELDWAALRPGEPLRRTPVPGYPYQRRAYWARPEQAEARRPPAPAVPAPVPDGAGTAFSVLRWVERPAPPPPAGTGTAPAAAPAAVLLPPDPQIALHLVLCLQQAGMRIVPLRAGERYSDEGAEFVVRPGRAEDLGRALRTIAARGGSAPRLVHACGIGPGPHDVDLVLQSLLDLVQQGSRAWPSAVPEVLVLADRSVDVSGGEMVDPVRAGLGALARTLALELGAGSCRLVDVGPGVSEPELVAELRRSEPEPVVALRRDRRWIPVERPCPVAPDGTSPLRRSGVYLITGGLGGLGLELAKGIARAGLRPRLVLLGRRAPDQPAGRDAPAASGDAGHRVRAGLAELAALGAEVHPFGVDVADLRALRRVADTVTARVGPVNGIFHLAGVPGDGMLLLRDRDRFGEVLRPKVAGTLALEEVFAGRPPLDFFVAFSSRAAVNGLVGSGDYAAANAFLDAFVATTSLAEGRAVSIGWPSWSEVGMAARPPADGAPTGAASGAGRSWQLVLRPEYPFLDEHRIDGTSVLPGTGQLDLLVRALTETFPDTAGAPVRLREVVLRHPLVVTGPRRVTIAFEPDANGWAFTLSTQATDGGESVVHATGQASADAPPAPAVDLVSIRERLTDRRAPEPINGPRRLFTFGPRWNNATELRLPPGGGPEKMVCLHLPEQFREDLDRHPLHPALLDTAVSSARDPERDGILLPFMYQSVVVHERLPATFTSYIVRHPAPEGLIVADITLVADDGRVLAEFEGFTMRVAQRNYLQESEAAADRARRADAGDPDRPADEGVPPDVGVRLTLELLASRPPRHVLVRPFRAGRPVPLPAAPRIDGSSSMDGGSTPVAPVPTRPAATAEQAAAHPGSPAGATGADDVPERLRRLWASALGSDDIGEGEDFFELGGNSLSAIDLMARIRAEFGVELNIALLFDHSTLDGVTEVVRGRLTAEHRRGG